MAQTAKRHRSTPKESRSNSFSIKQEDSDQIKALQNLSYNLFQYACHKKSII